MPWSTTSAAWGHAAGARAAVGSSRNRQEWKLAIRPSRIDLLLRALLAHLASRGGKWRKPSRKGPAAWRRCGRTALEAVDGEFGSGIGDSHYSHYSAWTGSVTTRSAASGTPPAMFRLMTSRPVSRTSRTASTISPPMSDPARHQRTSARQPGDCSDCFGQSLLAHQRDGVDGDVLAADIMAVRFRDGADGDLAHLCSAAHDDDSFGGTPLAISMSCTIGMAPANASSSSGVVGSANVEIDAALMGTAVEDLDRRDIPLMPRDDTRQLMQIPGPVAMVATSTNDSPAIGPTGVSGLWCADDPQPQARRGQRVPRVRRRRMRSSESPRAAVRVPILDQRNCRQGADHEADAMKKSGPPAAPPQSGPPWRTSESRQRAADL